MYFIAQSILDTLNEHTMSNNNNSIFVLVELVENERGDKQTKQKNENI